MIRFEKKEISDKVANRNGRVNLSSWLCSKVYIRADDSPIHVVDIAVLIVGVNGSYE